MEFATKSARGLTAMASFLAQVSDQVALTGPETGRMVRDCGNLSLELMAKFAFVMAVLEDAGRDDS